VFADQVIEVKGLNILVGAIWILGVPRGLLMVNGLPFVFSLHRRPGVTVSSEDSFP